MLRTSVSGHGLTTGWVSGDIRPGRCVAIYAKGARLFREQAAEPDDKRYASLTRVQLRRRNGGMWKSVASVL
jgi:hypothetical protein